GVPALRRLPAPEAVRRGAGDARLGALPGRRRVAGRGAGGIDRRGPRVGLRRRGRVPLRPLLGVFRPLPPPWHGLPGPPAATVRPPARRLARRPRDPRARDRRRPRGPPARAPDASPVPLLRAPARQGPAVRAAAGRRVLRTRQARVAGEARARA